LLARGGCEEGLANVSWSQVFWRSAMTINAREILVASEALPPAEQQQVAAEILRRFQQDRRPGRRGLQ
jgi:hypothetical protein